MPEFSGFPRETARFLADLEKNNDRAWFDAHRKAYDDYYVEPALGFVVAIGPRLRKLSPSVALEPRINGSLFRINRDVRFSKDKRPYKHHIDLWFWHGARKGWDTPGFFFRMYTDRLILGAGMHKFEKPQLAAFRKAVLDDRSGRALLKAADDMRGKGPYAIGGASRKTVPKGFDPDHPRAKFLLHEGLWAELVTKPGKVVETPKFVDFCAGHYAAMWPVASWLLKEVAPTV